MAADWTPMRNDLRDDPAVVSIAMTLGIDHDAVVGKLLAVWGWAGTHTVTGKCNGVTLAHVNHAARCEKFGDAMEAAGWLKRDAEGNVTFPRWAKGLLTFKSEYEADMAAMARATVQVCRQIERAAQLLQRARMFLEGGSIENRHERQHELCNEITAYLADEGDQ